MRVKTESENQKYNLHICTCTVKGEKNCIGRLQCYDSKRRHIFPTIGKCNKHDITNDNGLRLIIFGLERNIVSFQAKEIHKDTWMSANGKTVNEKIMP